MIIDNVDALKSWLAKLLEPICDADPSALANYVVALVKKDKPEKELRALCADQLDVFLQKETTGFVEKLFECLTTKNYLGNPLAKEIPKEDTKASAPKPAETEEISPCLQVGHVEDEKESRRRRSPLRNRSDFNESRNRDERRRDERRRREPERHGKSSEMYRERERERERNDRRRASSRGRSRSRSRSRSSSRGKSRDREQRREHRSKFEQERKEPEVYTPLSSGPLGKPPQQPPQLPLLPLPHPRSPFPPSGSPSIPSAVTAHLPDSTTENWTTYYSNHAEGKSGTLKHRCRDYDEKGFCVRGDLCPFDHGNDPLIVDDVALPTMIPFPPPGMPPARMPPPMPPMPEPLPVMPMPIPPHGQPPPPGIFPMADNYDPEAYNPESPAITGAGRAQYRQFIPRIQTQRPNLIGLTSGDTQSSRGITAANIVIQTEPSISIASSGEVRHSMELDSRKRSLESGNGPQAKKPWTDKQNFNNQHKPAFPKKNHYVNTKLEVRRIPRELNNITKLNEHFSKFGTIVNIQVVFGGDPEAALIQYTANEEARRAISSTEAVLNNRFIRVYWHRENTAQNQEQNANQSTSLSTQIPPVHKVINKPHAPGAYVLNKSFPKQQSTPGTGPAASVDPLSPAPESSLAVAPASVQQKGLYSRTVFKPTPKVLGKTVKALEDQDVLKKKQEALKLQQDMRKKKREMLEKQIEYQKVLINRLEKNRGMKPEERANIMKTLKELAEKISQLKNEISNSSVSQSAGNAAQPKTKTDAQKELLDAELDFHKKLTTGEDTTDLKRRLGQLQVEAKRLGLLPGGRAKPLVSVSRGRGRGRGRSGRGRGAPSHMVVDHRPRTLAILGVTQEEKEELMPHFVKFGEIEELRDQDATSVVMTFKTRSEAENAANQGAKFKGRILQISWYKPKTPSVTTEPEEVESKEEVNAESVSPFLLPEEEEEDDDEDDDYESRSWRR
ncbi:RNA-binding protein 27 isoform X5 [Hemibagrus wyckioides]|uniref:RNA-binding protein 27 isoform X5 n=1 Tax=Hemibagrus wyckioides TaxID=337641 RepID=UPI00266B62D2|nr:RNA-binding protein 27 isoform X5 [Hemibagrus wyckioides]